MVSSWRAGLKSRTASPDGNRQESNLRGQSLTHLALNPTHVGYWLCSPGQVPWHGPHRVSVPAKHFHFLPCIHLCAFCKDQVADLCNANPNAHLARPEAP